RERAVQRVADYLLAALPGKELVVTVAERKRRRSDEIGRASRRRRAERPATPAPESEEGRRMTAGNALPRVQPSEGAPSRRSPSFLQAATGRSPDWLISACRSSRRDRVPGQGPRAGRPAGSGLPAGGLARQRAGRDCGRAQAPQER